MQFQQYYKFINPIVLITIMIKTMILFAIVLNMAVTLDNLFPKVDKNKQKLIVWAEVLGQVSIIVVATFLLRTVIEILGDAFDPLEQKMSSITAKASSFIAGYALYSRQKNLSAKINIIMK